MNAIRYETTRDDTTLHVELCHDIMICHANLTSREGMTCVMSHDRGRDCDRDRDHDPDPDRGCGRFRDVDGDHDRDCDRDCDCDRDRGCDVMIDVTRRSATSYA